MFKTIKANVSAEIVEKKSKFIANVFYVETMEEVDKIVKETKKKYHDARHNCYACIVESGDGEGAFVKFNDDGEPSGTAGAPMLNVIANLGLSNTLVIVTRYFGGILLGTGGLVRAYTESLKKALEKVEYINKTIGQEVNIYIDYSDLEQAKYYLKQNNIKIANIEYGENIIITIEIEKNKIAEITNFNSKNSFNIIKYDILKEKYIEI